MLDKHMKIYPEEWEKTAIGKRFSSLGFHMFTVDQQLSTYEDEGESVIRMTLGKSDRPLPTSVTDKMKEAFDNPKDILRVDSEGNPELREEVVRYFYRRFGTKFPTKNVIVGSQGTSSLFRDLFILLLQNGGKVLLPKPGYILYEASAMLVQALRNDVEIDYYPIDLHTGRIDIAKFDEAFDNENTRVVVINSPGNPSGNVISSKELSLIIEKVNNGNNAVLISDQVYSNVVFCDDQYPSILNAGLIEKLKRPYIITDSMSKGFEMYTYRVGFAIVPDTLVSPLITFQRNFSLTPNNIGQIGAIQALRQDGDVSSLRSIYKSRYLYAMTKLATLTDVHPCPSDGGFYMLIDCCNFISKSHFQNDLELALDISEKTIPHVGTTPGSDFGAPGYLRLSFSPERFNEGIDLLHLYFSQENYS